jgi:hypothetical protein
VRVFRQEFTLEDAIGSHACLLQANMCVTQWHSSRVPTPLTGWHCKFRPNTEGQHDESVVVADHVHTSTVLGFRLHGWVGLVGVVGAVGLHASCWWFDANMRAIR